MSESTRIDGMSAQQAALSLGRVPIVEDTPAEASEVLSSAEAVVLEIESCGSSARIVQLREGDLAYLDAPTLLQLLDGTWIRFRSRRGKIVEAGTANGAQRIAIEELWPRLSGAAVQVIADLAPGDLWRKTAASLLERRGVLMQVAAGSLLLIVLALIPPQLTRLIIDRALPGGAASLLQILALSVLLIAVFRAWIGWLRAAAILYVKNRTEATLNAGFLVHLLRLPFSYLSRKTQGELLQGFSGLSAAQSLLTDRVVATAFDGVTAILYLVVMFTMLPMPALMVLAGAVTMAGLAAYFSRVQARLQRDETAAQIRERDYLVELLSGAATIKASGSEDRRLREWMARLQTQLALALRRQRVGLWSSAAQEVISQGLTIAMLVWCASLVLSDRLTVGSLLAFQQMGGALVSSVLGLMTTYSIYTVLEPQLAVTKEVLGLEPAPRRTKHASPGKLGGPIVLDRVWFRYEPHLPWVVRDLSLEVRPGERRWIQGPSGFGKSTILRLIAGIYQPERGSIRVGGKTPADANDQMVYLPQFVQLYGTSILENLRIFSGGATRKRLMEAAEASGLHAMVSTLPMGYETVMPSSGATLSGGERQLVAFTAVMASQRSLVLLDEGLANVDWLSRFWIANSSWFDGKTIIYASHDSGFDVSKSTK